MSDDQLVAQSSAEPKQSQIWVKVVVIVGVVLLVLCCCVLFVIFGIPAILMMLGPAIGNVFSTITENLMMP